MKNWKHIRVVLLLVVVLASLLIVFTKAQAQWYSLPVLGMIVVLIAIDIRHVKRYGRKQFLSLFSTLFICTYCLVALVGPI